MKKTIRFLSIFIFALVLLPSVAGAAEEIAVKRLAGDSRVDTSIKISQEAYTRADTAILVGSKGEIDALTGSLLAKVKEGPIFYVNDRYLKDVKERLTDLKVKKVYVLGGEEVFSKKLFKEFKDFSPSRLEGANRYDTAVRIAKKSVGKTSGEVFLALGKGIYADALSIGPVSARKDKPLLLTGEKDLLPQETLAALKSMKVKKVSIIGGEVAISKRVEKQIEKLGIESERTFGDSREETSLAIAKKFNPGYSNVVVANGWTFADAVVGGYFASKNDGVLLLSRKEEVDPSILNFIEERPTPLFVLGGLEALDSSVFTSLLESTGGLIEVDSLDIVKARALGKKTIQVKLDREIDPAKARIKVKRGSSYLTVSKLDFLEDNSVIEINLEEVLKSGRYDIIVSGVLNSSVYGRAMVGTSKKVSSEKDFTSALKDKKIDVIELNKDFSLKKTMIIERPLRIEGNNHMLTTKSPSALDVWSDDVVINNIKIKGSLDNGIGFWTVKGGELNNITLQDGAWNGLVVYSSQVRARNIRTLNNKESGITLMYDRYDKRSIKPELILTGNNKHISPKGKLTPAINIHSSSNKGFVFAEGYVEKKYIDEGGFKYYHFYDEKEYKAK